MHLSHKVRHCYVEVSNKIDKKNIKKNVTNNSSLKLIILREVKHFLHKKTFSQNHSEHYRLPMY